MGNRENVGTKGVPRAEREQQILSVASVVFGTHGYAATNLIQVGQDAGISKPLIYSYFGSKEGLYASCLQQGGELLGDEIERIAHGGSVGIERGVRTLQAMFQVLEGRRHLWRLLHDPTAPQTDRIARITRQHTDRLTHLAHEGVSELLELTGVTDPTDASAMTATWLGIVDSLMDWWVDHPDESAASMAERVQRLTLAVATVGNGVGGA